MTRLAFVALPVFIALALVIAVQVGGLANPILFMRIDLGTLVLLTGAMVGGLAALGFAIQAHTLRRNAVQVSETQHEGEEAHRQFVRRLDHEMKNPLTAVRAALANINGAGSDAALTTVHCQIDRLSRLTSDLRKLTDLELLPIETGPVDVGQLLAELVQEVCETPATAQRCIDISLPRVPWPLPNITGDRDLIFLACHNLVENALKFSGPDARIEVRAFEDGPWIAVEVADTGPGISSDDLPHLGEDLFRGRSALGIEGSGLGLALVRAIAHRHGGAMTVRSRPGKGTVVTLRFPAAG